MNGYFIISDHGKVKPVYEQKFSHTSNTDAIERQLFQQISGKDLPESQVSPQLAAQWARFQATRQQPSHKEVKLEELLFQQVAELYGKIPLNRRPLTRESI